jgi:carboxylesterase
VRVGCALTDPARAERSVQLEWAWLRDQRPVKTAASDIVLNGPSRCRLLLFHGLTGSPAELSYIAHYVHRRGQVNVECPQLVNHGQPISVLARTRMDEIYAGARRNLERAHQACARDGLPLVVGGLSLGAILSLMLAAEEPEVVAGVVCMSPTLFYDGWNVPWTHRLIPLADYIPLKYFAYLRESPPYGLKNEALRARVAAVYERASLHDHEFSARLGYAHFPIALFCEMRHLIRRCIDLLPRVTAPLLLLQAEEDDITSPRNSRFIRDRVASRRKELVLLRRSYHVVTADDDREEVAAAVTAFCGEIVDPAARR